jgi:hypothetical protein
MKTSNSTVIAGDLVHELKLNMKYTVPETCSNCSFCAKVHVLPALPVQAGNTPISPRTHTCTFVPQIGEFAVLPTDVCSKWTKRPLVAPSQPVAPAMPSSY